MQAAASPREAAPATSASAGVRPTSPGAVRPWPGHAVRWGPAEGRTTPGGPASAGRLAIRVSDAPPAAARRRSRPPLPPRATRRIRAATASVSAGSAATQWPARLARPRLAWSNAADNGLANRMRLFESTARRVCPGPPARPWRPAPRRWPRSVPVAGEGPGEDGSTSCRARQCRSSKSGDDSGRCSPRNRESADPPSGVHRPGHMEDAGRAKMIGKDFRFAQLLCRDQLGPEERGRIPACGTTDRPEIKLMVIFTVAASVRTS